MLAATLQPSWLSRPKTNVTFLFYFLKLYNFGLNRIFAGSTSSELQHPWISKITTERQINRIIIDFRAKFNNTSNQYNSFDISPWWNVTFLEFKVVNSQNLCESTARTIQKRAYFYVMEAKKWPFFTFFFLLEAIDCTLKKKILVPTRNRLFAIRPQLTKNFMKIADKLLLSKRLWRFRQIGKWQFP